jgi:hypothetical protein
MFAGDDQISRDDSSSFPDQVAVNRFSMSASIFPRELNTSLILLRPGAAVLFFLGHPRAQLRAARSDAFRPVVISEHEG